MQRPKTSISSRPSSSPQPQPSAPASPPSCACAHRVFQVDRLCSPSQPGRFDKCQSSLYREPVAPTCSITTTTSPHLSYANTALRPSSAGGRDRFARTPASTENGVASPINTNDSNSNSNSNTTGNCWMSRCADPLRPSHFCASYAHGADAAPWTTNAATLPALSRLSPYARVMTSAQTTATPATRGTIRAVSQPQPLAMPPSSSVLPPATAAMAWTRLRTREGSSTASPGGFSATPIVSKTTVPLVAQLQLSELSVRELDLGATNASAVPVLLRGLFSDTSEFFRTDIVWPKPEQCRPEDCQQIDAVQTFSAAWPGTTVGELLNIPTADLNGEALLSRSLVCECYVCDTVPTAPPQLRSKVFIGRSQVTLGELVEATSCNAQKSTPVEVVLRDDNGGVVGCLSFTVALLPLPYRTVRVTNVTVLPDPLQVDQEEGEEDAKYTSGINGSNFRRDTVEDRRVSCAAVHEGKLGLRLKAPQSEGEASSGGTITHADFRTPAVVRWTALPPFSFYDVSSKMAKNNAEDATGQPRTSGLSQQQQIPLVIGELYYCPSKQQQQQQYSSGSRSSNLQSDGTTTTRSQVLLGTFAILAPLASLSPASAAATTASPLDISDSLQSYRIPVAHAGVTSCPFRVPLRASTEGGRWVAMGDCWVRGVVETWTEETGTQELAAMLAGLKNTVPLSLAPAIAPAADAAESGRFARAVAHKSSEELIPQHPLSTLLRSTVNSTGHAQVQRAGEPPVVLHPPQGRSSGNQVSGMLSPHPPPAHPSTPPQSSRGTPPTTASALADDTTPRMDMALQRVWERQEALINRVEFRLAEVRKQRQHLKDDMAAKDAEATAEKKAILEEFGVLESQQSEAEASYREATAQLAELQQLHADRVAEHDAYLAEQTRALDEVARERAEAVELRAQLETLQAQMRAHMEAEQQRYAARVEHTRAAMSRVEANTRWLTEVEAKIAAAESQQPGNTT